MAIRVDTHEYEWCHARKPRTQHGQASAWAFALDGTPTVVWVQGTYREAVRQAKKQAQHSVKVLA
jgi:hypothetical protein